MLQILKNLQHYWVMAYYCEKESKAFRGKLLVRAPNEQQAMETFRQYFIVNGFPFAYYESIISLQSYLEQSLQSELLCIQALNTIANRKALIFEEREVTYPLAIEQSFLSIKAIESIQCELRDEYVYIIVDGARYHAISGRFLLPVLYSLNCQWASLLKGETQLTLEDNAPYFVELPAKQNCTLTQRQFLTFCTENSVGIVLQSSATFATLYNHLRKFTYMAVSDQATWCFFRFYDPEIFHLLITHLNVAEIKHFLRDIKSCYFLKEGQAQALYYHVEQVNETAVKPITITPYLQQIFQYYQQSLLIKKLEENLPASGGLDHVELSTTERKTQITQKLNQAYLLGLTHPKALYYFLIAQINFPNENWLSRWEAARAYSSSQEIYALHYLELTLNAVS